MTVPAKSPRQVEIIDIRRGHYDTSLLESIDQCLNPTDGSPKSMPTLLLYDEAGLKLFEAITYLDEYYLTNAEIEVLTIHADKIAERVAEGTQLIELGSGNLRKVDILLQALEKSQKRVHYYALDLSLPELKRTFAEISPESYQYVTLAGLHGTYDDGLAWLSKPANRIAPSCIMSLGSSLGNFSRQAAGEFLKGFAKVMTVQDTMLVGLDACEDPDRIFRAYNDSAGVTERFYRNGLDHANRLLGQEAFKQDEWLSVGSYDKDMHRHEAHYVALKDVVVNGTTLKKGEKLKFEESSKYTRAESDVLWNDSGLIRTVSFENKSHDYNLHMLVPFKVVCVDSPAKYASQPVPTLGDFEHLWNTWDTVTRAMVPTEDLLAKPIQLRNCLIFYLGHIPTFADMHITKATGQPATDPAYYPQIFERGIDPDVENPNKCHAHSEIPKSWPPLDEILVFQNRVRFRVRELFISHQVDNDRKLGRALWLAFEHEAMHLETFIYMLLQSSRILPPPDHSAPNFRQIDAEAREHSRPNKWFNIPATHIKIGLDDPENDDGPDRYFGWDNERPSRTVSVPAFEAQARPITVGDYALFLQENHIAKLPASWTTSTGSQATNGIKLSANGVSVVSNGDTPTRPSESFLTGKAVRTVYGHVPLRDALTWPVMASYNELADYASWMHGRIPTMEEARSIYSYVEELKKDSAEKTPSTLVPAVNGHLSNDGVEETPPQGSGHTNFTNGEHSTKPAVENHFIDLQGCNVGFKNWHPMPVVQHGDTLCGQSDFGGVWEWTSSTLEKFEGFKPMDLYPGYTADFFDEKHNILLGGSWATHPRIAGRKSYVNWYQRSYPFVWAGARLVRDIQN